MESEVVIGSRRIALIGGYDVKEGFGGFSLSRHDTASKLPDLKGWVFSSKDDVFVIAWVFSLAFDGGTSRGKIRY